MRSALEKIQKEKNIKVLKTSKIYITKAVLLPGSPKTWDKDYLNAAIKIQTTLSPIELLKALKEIEIKMGCDSNHSKWSPRIIDLDILYWEDKILDLAELKIPHPLLMERNFALYPLSEIDPLWRHPKKPEKRLHVFLKTLPPLKTAPYRFEGTKIMGVLNMTPISMSGLNKKLSVKEMKEAIIEMVNNGAEIIDIGGESTRPGAIPISLHEEWKRIYPLIKELSEILKDQRLLTRPQVSVDTYHAETVKKLVSFDIDIINDVSGKEKEQIIKYIKGKKIKYILVHNVGKAGENYIESDETQFINQMIHWFSDTIDELVKLGLDKNKIIIDPGIGFGKTTRQTSLIIKHIRKFKDIGIPVLVGHSRKASAMPSVSWMPAQERDLETAWLSKYFLEKGVDYVRVHNCFFSSRLMQM